MGHVVSRVVPGRVEVVVYLDVRRGQPGDGNLIIMSRILAHCTRRMRRLFYQGRQEGAFGLQSTSMATTAISRIVATIQVPTPHVSLVVQPDGL